MMDNEYDSDIEELLGKIEDSNQAFFDDEYDEVYKYPNKITESSKTDLGLIELHTPSDNDIEFKIDPYITNGYIYINSIVLHGFMNYYDYYVENQLTQYKQYIIDQTYSINKIKHPNIRNYTKIRLNYQPSVEIVKRVYYKGYTLAILKTCWLRIFQKKFRNRCKKRMAFMCNHKNLYYKEINGKWPSEFYQI
jgi:hypothetical protein